MTTPALCSTTTTLCQSHRDGALSLLCRVHGEVFPQRAKRYTLEEYVLKNFDPGVYDFFHGEVGMTEEDISTSRRTARIRQHHVPQVYDGMRRHFVDYVHAGGTICSCRTRSRRTSARLPRK